MKITLENQQTQHFLSLLHDYFYNLGNSIRKKKIHIVAEVLLYAF